MASRTTRLLRRRLTQMLLRIEGLEQQVSELRLRLGEVEAQREGDQGRPLPPAVPERRSRFEREMEPAEGARLVARHMLRSGTPVQNVAAHLEETFDLADADSVVEQVAHYDSRPSEPNQEGR